MSPRQRRAWTFAAATVPAVMVCAGRSWHWVLIGSAGAAGYYLILYFLRRAGGMTLAESYQAGFGRISGRIVLALTAGWTLLTLANAATGAAAAFPGEEARLAPAAVLLLAGLACRRGTDVPARCAAVAAPVLAGLYAVLLFAAAPGVHSAWCRPWGTPTAAAETAAAMLLPTTGLLLAGKEHEERAPAGPLAVMLLGPVLMALLTAGNLSPQITAAEKTPFYTLTKTLSLLSVMERFEPLLSAALFAGVFCMASLLTETIVKCAAADKNIGIKQWYVWAVCIAAFVLMEPVRQMPEMVWSIGAAIFWGVAPLLAQVIVAIKKVEKSLDKRRRRW